MRTACAAKLEFNQQLVFWNPKIVQIMVPLPENGKSIALCCQIAFKMKEAQIEKPIRKRVRKLTGVQAETIVRHITKLSDRGLPSIAQIGMDIAGEISQARFVLSGVSILQWTPRTADECALRTIDHKRKLADNSHHCQHF
jgi:hypothetical protein